MIFKIAFGMNKMMSKPTLRLSIERAEAMPMLLHPQDYDFHQLQTGLVISATGYSRDDSNKSWFILSFLSWSTN